MGLYESMGVKGWIAFEKTVEYIKKNYPDQFIIADAKRGDIGNTSAMYARTFFEELNIDSVTVAPYMGEDSVTPFLTYEGKWVILLALTSNKGSHDFQLTADPEGCPVCISGRRMGRQHDLSVDKFFLLVVEFCFLVVLAEQPFAALVSGPGNSGLPLAALNDGNFEMRTRNRHHPQTKRPPSKIALDERSGIVFGCAHRLRTECYALRS